LADERRPNRSAVTLHPIPSCPGSMRAGPLSTGRAVFPGLGRPKAQGEFADVPQVSQKMAERGFAA